MGILERIAGTLSSLPGEGGADSKEAREEVVLAMAFAERGDAATAEQRLDDVAARFPKLALPWLRLGQLRARRGALDEAVTALGRAVDVDGDDAEAWGALGDALARLGRAEPARDALRRAIALAVDDRAAPLRGRAHAALGRVYAATDQLPKALRELRKALELLQPAGGEPDAEVAEVELLYGRALARAGEVEAAEWLTRAARRDARSVRLFTEAAAASGDPALAERLLRDGLARARAGLAGEGTVRVALARHLARGGRAEEALVLAAASVEAAPDDADALGALRESYGAAGRWSDALAVTTREAAAGRPPALAVQIALGLAAGDHAGLRALADRAAKAAVDGAGDDDSEDAPARAALRAFVEGRATDEQLMILARLAPQDDARRYLAAAGAPPPPPGDNLVALLGWSYALATRAPELVGLAVPAGRAAEAFDRPLLVAVMGEFNAGKSSVVNALCGDEVAPTGVTPTTATVNVLRYGPDAGGRVVYHDGRVRELGPGGVAAFLATLGSLDPLGELGDAEASAVRMVEIFRPLEALRRVEIVDTPGLNSIRPAHEKVARDFLTDADAIVWVFAAGQAAKASEREALGLAHAAGKRVLGVLNKVDRASADEVQEVLRHVQAGLADLVETVMPLSATRALKARRAGKTDTALAALEGALETRFFAEARALKRTTALAALRRFLAEARAAATPPPAVDFAGRRAELRALDERLRGAVAAERVALRARIDETYRAAAFEVRDFVRPRAWLFGEHRAEPADEEFLIELLDDAVERASEVSRAALLAEIGAALPDAARAVTVAVDRFQAYARGVIAGGAVAEFFRYHLPRIRLEPGAIRNALAPRAPDPEPALFDALSRDLTAALAAAEDALDAAEDDAVIRASLRAARLQQPLDALAVAVEDLAAAHASAHHLRNDLASGPVADAPGDAEHAGPGDR